MSYAGKAEKAEEVVAEIRAAGGRAIAVPADVADPKAVDRLFKQAQEELGKVDVVVNCDGIMPLRPIAEGDLELFDKVIATNLRGSFVVLAQAAREVAAGGRIIMFSSSVLAKSFPSYGPYIASKAGVEGLVHEGGQHRVNCVWHRLFVPDPRRIETQAVFFCAVDFFFEVEQFKKLAPLERLGQPDDIAGVVSFLAGPEGVWVNGQVLRANGGFA